MDRIPQYGKKARLLVVDDEENVRRSLQGVLADQGYGVECVRSGRGCLRKLKEKSFDVILLDVWLPEKDGIEILQAIRHEYPSQYIVMISGHGSIETAVRATKLGAFDFIEKPLSTEKLVLVLEHALRQKRLEQENRSLKDILDQETVMIGNSVPMRALHQQIRYAAPTEGRILIYGENGTGKELVARLVHLKSSRANQPFVEVNCAAIPEDLIESELFGTVRGAYTGATENRSGKFALADGGTLFLDEVGDMSVKTQSKVLRVLEEQRFYPVGGNQPLDVDVRVLAATNKNLEEQIENGNFRQDLFFRLNVIPFEVPPLRQRKEDIPELVDFFLNFYSRRYGKPKKRISEGSIERLQSHQWPGNVRELKNTIERLVIMVPGEEIQDWDLPVSILRHKLELDQDQTWRQARQRFERQFIMEKLIANGGNISRTAVAIGMERTHLHRKLKRYNIKTR